MKTQNNTINMLKNGLFLETLKRDVRGDNVFNVPELVLLQLQQLMASFPKKFWRLFSIFDEKISR